MVELTSSPEKIDSFVDLVRPFGIKEMVRTGRIAMVRGTPSHSAETYVRVA
jgi:acetolactate synthase-1/3 small subunit